MSQGYYLQLLKKFFSNANESLPFILVAGPCSLESYEISEKILSEILSIIQRINKDIIFVFKMSYDKANRSQVHSFRGPSFEKAMDIFKRIKKNYPFIPILTDIHCRNELDKIIEYVDIIQIPAFLARQTDLIVKSAETKKIINVKKPNFLSAKEMKWVAEKILSTQNNQFIFTERGSFFGYNQLINDFKSIPIMKDYSPLVLYDATHSVQKPGLVDAPEGDERKWIPLLSKAAITVGASGLYMEVHIDPESSLSDKYCILNVYNIEKWLREVIDLFIFINKK